MISVYKSNPLWMNFISLISLFQKEFHSIWNTALKTKCVHVGVFLYDSSDFIKFILSKRNFLDFNGLSSKLHLTYCTFSQMNFNSFVSLLQREFHSIWMGATKTNCVHDGTMNFVQRCHVWILKSKLSTFWNNHHEVTNDAFPRNTKKICQLRPFSLCIRISIGGYFWNTKHIAFYNQISI